MCKVQNWWNRLTEQNCEELNLYVYCCTQSTSTCTCICSYSVEDASLSCRKTKAISYSSKHLDPIILGLKCLGGKKTHVSFFLHYRKKAHLSVQETLMLNLEPNALSVRLPSVAVKQLFDWDRTTSTTTGCFSVLVCCINAFQSRHLVHTVVDISAL